MYRTPATSGTLITIGVGLVVAFAGCAVTGGNGSSGSTAAEASGPQVIQLGTPILIDGVRVTIEDAQVARMLDFQEPAPGSVYVAYKVAAEAVDKDQSISSSDFTVASDGSAQGKSAFVVADQWEPRIGFESVKRGKTISGWIVFEVPEPSEFLELAYDARFFSEEPTFLLRTPCCEGAT